LLSLGKTSYLLCTCCRKKRKRQKRDGLWQTLDLTNDLWRNSFDITDKTKCPNIQHARYEHIVVVSVYERLAPMCTVRFSAFWSNPWTSHCDLKPGLIMLKICEIPYLQAFGLSLG
jgi:hypothetical protein